MRRTTTAGSGRRVAPPLMPGVRRLEQRIVINSGMLPVLGILVSGLHGVAALAQAVPHVDHVILGISRLDTGMKDFDQLTGVRPVYGGKHPTGTENALVSLGDGTYLEIIAPQAGVAADAGPELAGLLTLKTLTPVGWAVASQNLTELRKQLTNAAFPVSAPDDGSRVTPSSGTLRWQTFDLATSLEGAPFFIVWADRSAHPSSTSPSGCSLERLAVASPDGDALQRLGRALDLAVEFRVAPKMRLSLTLGCSQGSVAFSSEASHP